MLVIKITNLQDNMDMERQGRGVSHMDVVVLPAVI